MNLRGILDLVATSKGQLAVVAMFRLAARSETLAGQPSPLLRSENRSRYCSGMVAAWQSIDVDSYDTEELRPVNGWAVLLTEIEDRRPAWQLEAACRHEDVEQFFPTRGEPVAPAKELCATCPAQDACRDYADAEGIGVGIWGGQTWGRVAQSRTAA